MLFFVRVERQGLTTRELRTISSFLDLTFSSRRRLHWSLPFFFLQLSHHHGRNLIKGVQVYPYSSLLSTLSTLRRLLLVAFILHYLKNAVQQIFHLLHHRHCLGHQCHRQLQLANPDVLRLHRQFLFSVSRTTRGSLSLGLQRERESQRGDELRYCQLAGMREPEDALL
ncbi:hypothetical protein EI94DRAFT_1049752 [Lactarius quietus]|nr:hypothetical protein EI94DRAFT_1049752 [Lactarius quietus]